MKQPEVSPNLFKYRVLLGEEIVGTYSSRELAGKTAHDYHGIVLDVSVQPPKLIYKNGTWLERTK